MAQYTQSIAADQLDLYCHLPEGAKRLQSSVAHRIFRLLLRLRHGKMSTIYMKTASSWWVEIDTYDESQWAELPERSKRNIIESSIAYCLHLLNYDGFKFIARVWPCRHLSLPAQVEREMRTLRAGAARKTHGSNAGRTRIAIAPLGAVEDKLAAIAHIAKWLELIIGPLEIVVHLPKGMPISNAPGGADIHYHCMNKTQLEYVLSMSKAGTLFFSPEEESKKGKVRLSLENLLDELPYHVVLISAEEDVLDRRLWTARLARALNTWGGSAQIDKQLVPTQSDTAHVLAPPQKREMVKTAARHSFGPA